MVDRLFIWLTLLPLAVLPSLGQWLVIGAFGALAVGRWLRAGQAVAARPQMQKEHPAGLGRIERLKVPLCTGIAMICFFVGLELIRDGQWAHGLMILACAGAAAAMVFAFSQR